MLFFYPFPLTTPPSPQKKKGGGGGGGQNASLALLYLNLIEWCLRFCFAFLGCKSDLGQKKYQECLEMFLMTCS